MSFFKNLFGKKDQPIHSYKDFWDWFVEHQQTFFKVVKTQDDIHYKFFGKLTPRLEELREGYYFLTGMKDQDTAELIFSAEGTIKQMVFVEELVDEAPQLENWVFTALKQAQDMTDLGVGMRDFSLTSENLYFYAIEHKDKPDLIEITIVQDDLKEENRDLIHNGVYIYLDNSLGELHFATAIDVLNIIGPDDAAAELVPITKLDEYLTYRQKEFIEKYEGTWHKLDEDKYSILETTLDDGQVLIAVVNTDLLQWDSKASHPWIMEVEMDFKGTANNGMPNEATTQLMDAIEEEINAKLIDTDGYLNVGRLTGRGKRSIFFACKTFRYPSKVIDQLSRKYEDQIEMDYDIFKDKYWQAFDRFQKKL